MIDFLKRIWTSYKHRRGLLAAAVAAENWNTEFRCERCWYAVPDGDWRLSDDVPPRKYG